MPDGTPGALLTRGPYTPRGYYRAPEHNARSFTADGWYGSGDIVRRRPDGNLIVEGRDKDMINRGGEKIRAEEVENLVYRLPRGRARSPRWPCPTPNSANGCASTWCRSRAARSRCERSARQLTAAGVAAFKLPERLELVDELPMTKVGKIDKKALRETSPSPSPSPRNEPFQHDDWSEPSERPHHRPPIWSPAPGRPATAEEERRSPIDDAGLTPSRCGPRSALMPMTPQPQILPHVWRGPTLLPLAERAGDLIPVGRGGERRAIALANPGLGGRPYATPTLWAAIQYLGGHEVAPEHRHSQNAFRFVVEGEGVWTVVNGDPVAMRRGDFLLTPGWNFHGHHNETDQPMAWIDGLDIPFVHYTDTSFFEFGSDRVTDESTPSMSRSEKLWCHPGLRPLSQLQDTVSSPIGAYRWEHTDAALTQQLELEAAGFPATVEQGHAAVRYINPTTGGDVMPTIRAEFHRLAAGARTRTTRTSASSVWQVFEGTGSVLLG